jgi:hypothetical protein
VSILINKGYVYTLLNGACFEYSMQGQDVNAFKYKRQFLLCLRKWIKTYGYPDEHIVKTSTTDTCYDNIVQCKGSVSQLIKERNENLLSVENNN